MTHTKKRIAFAVLVGLLSLAVAGSASAKKSKKKRSGSAASVPEHPRDLTYPALADISLPEPERFTLDNGMQVLLLANDELPLVQGRALVRTGSRLEPADKAGLAALTGTVIRSGGTERMPSDELDSVLENMAASVESSIGGTGGNVVMSALAEDFDEVLAIFADVLRRPAFEQEKLDVAKTQAKAGIARQNDNPGQILGREFPQLIYGDDSPYARDTTYTTIDAVGREDLIAWHAEYYHPENVILGITGDFDAATIRQQIEAVLGDWPRGSGTAPTPTDVSARHEPGVYFVEKSDVNQANIAIGHLGIERDNPDYFAIEVLNEVFGGGFTSRLVREIRSNKGLAYSVGGGVRSSWDYPGLFRMQMSTKTESTGEAIAALLEEARRIIAEPPTPSELERAKEAMLASMVFTADSASEILQRQLTYAYYDFPSDWLSRYQKEVAAVTFEQVSAAAKKYIQPDQLAILVVGSTADTEPALDSFGTLTEVDISIPEPEVETVRVTEAGKEKGAGLIAKAVAAAGGAERIDGITGLRIAADNQVVTPQGTFDVSTVSVTALPDRQRTEITLPFGTMIQVLDGNRSWVKTPQGVQDMPPPMRDQAIKNIRRAYHNLLRARGQGDFVAVAAGSGEVEGTAVENVQVQLGDDLLRLGIDPASGHILSVTYRGTNNAGAPGEIRQVHRDFQSVDGLLVPHDVAVTFEGDPMMSIKVTEVTISPEITDDLFARPE